MKPAVMPNPATVYELWMNGWKDDHGNALLPANYAALATHLGVDLEYIREVTLNFRPNKLPWTVDRKNLQQEIALAIRNKLKEKNLELAYQIQTDTIIRCRDLLSKWEEQNSLMEPLIATSDALSAMRLLNQIAQTIIGDDTTASGSTYNTIIQNIVIPNNKPEPWSQLGKEVVDAEVIDDNGAASDD